MGLEDRIPPSVAFTAATMAQVNEMRAWAAFAVARLEQEAETQPPAVVVQADVEPCVPLWGPNSLASPVAFDAEVIARREALRNGPRVGGSHSVSPTSVMQ